MKGNEGGTEDILKEKIKKKNSGHLFDAPRFHFFLSSSSIWKKKEEKSVPVSLVRHIYTRISHYR